MKRVLRRKRDCVVPFVLFAGRFPGDSNPEGSASFDPSKEDESFGDGSFAVPAAGAIIADPVEAVVEDYAARGADTPAAREALRQIASAAIEYVEPDAPPPELFNAHRTLNREAHLGIGGVGAVPRTARATTGRREGFVS